MDEGKYPWGCTCHMGWPPCGFCTRMNEEQADGYYSGELSIFDLHDQWEQEEEAIKITEQEIKLYGGCPRRIAINARKAKENE